MGWGESKPQERKPESGNYCQYLGTCVYGSNTTWPEVIGSHVPWMGESLGNICSCSPNRLNNSFINYFWPSIASILSFWEYGDNQDLFKVVLDPWVGKIPWRRAWKHNPVFLLENPMDREVWWSMVAKIQMQLKWLSTEYGWRTSHIRHPKRSK